MRTAIALATAVVMSAALAAQVPQEKKPVPKDSVRVNLSGCTKGYMFTVVSRMTDIVGGVNIRPGTHLRMNGPKKLIKEIGAYKDSMVSITGLIKKGELGPGGVNLGPVTLGPAQPPSSPGGLGAGAVPQPAQIDVEGWAPSTGMCPS